MNVRELIEYLQDNHDPETQVFVSRDAEGNEFSAVDAVDLAYVAPGEEELWRLEGLVFEEDLEDDDDVENYTKIVVVWPV